MNIHELDKIEKDSIRRFVAAAGDDGFLSGRVLDYGCGKQPYADIVRAHGEYWPYDEPDLPGGNGGEVGSPDVLNQPWQAILFTQVIQYVPDTYRVLRMLNDTLVPTRGYLVMTYPTCWPEIPYDLQRFTRHGMARLLRNAGFKVVRHEQRAAIPFDGFALALGYGVIGRAG